MNKLLIMVFVILFFGNYAAGQNTTSRLTIESGGSVNFYFNSLEKYKNGITYTDWTKLRIYYNDTTDAGGIGIYPTWKLDVKALSPTIDGDAGNTLNLNTIELEATGNPGSTGVQALSNIDVSLITGGAITAPATTVIFITYNCGKSILTQNSLIGKNPDHYVIDIVFTLGRN